MKYDTDKLIADTNLIEAASMLGVKMSPNKKVRCMLHNDKEPSMVLYKNRYKCFVCGTGRTIDFVQKVGGMSFTDACEWLIENFGLDKDQYVKEDKRKPVPKGNRASKRTYRYVKPEDLEAIGIVNNPVKAISTALPVDSYKEINYRGFVGYVKRNLPKYLPKEYSSYNATIVLEEVRKKSIQTKEKGKQVECFKLVNPDNPEIKMPFIYIQNIYDAMTYSRNTKKVLSEYAKLYIEAINSGQEEVEEYRVKSIFNYHVEREEECCVRYDVLCQNPLQELFENDKEAYEFLINSCAKEKNFRINTAEELSRLSRGCLNRRQIQEVLINMKKRSESIRKGLLHMSNPA